jgi:hypothetical protein
MRPHIENYFTVNNLNYEREKRSFIKNRKAVKLNGNAIGDPLTTLSFLFTVQHITATSDNKNAFNAPKILEQVRELPWVYPPAS